MMLKSLFLILLIARISNGLKCWTCDGKRSVAECHAQFGKMLECNPGDVCKNDYRTANGEVIITKGCKQKTSCETEVRQNKDKNQCGSKLFKTNMACRCCCATNGCNKKESGCLPPPPPCERLSLRNGRFHCLVVDIKFGTRCRFSCNPGFKLEGDQFTTCKRITGRKYGEWDNPPPKCIPDILRCRPQRKGIANADLACTNTKEFEKFALQFQFNYEGSECTYTCHNNYYLVGRKSAVCKEDGKWSAEVPSCKRGTCKVGKRDQNRINKCSEGFKFGSKCEFSCREGYKLVGRKFSDCEQFGKSSTGTWTNGIPRCQRIECPKLENPMNGVVTCPKGRNVNSTCVYKCNDGFDLDDTISDKIRTTCQYVNEKRIAADWSVRPPPTCTRIKCIPPRENPENGLSDCSRRNWLGSVCKLTCNDGHYFEKDGVKSTSLQTVCRNDGDGDQFGEWSLAEIDCKPMVCDPESIRTDNTVVSCTNGFRKDSECTITCESGFAFKGEVRQDETKIVSKCGSSYKGSLEVSWSRANIFCAPITCPRLEQIGNGSTECTGNGRVQLGGSCQFACNDEYKLEGSSITVCVDKMKDNDEIGDWSEPMPKCVLDPCEMPLYDTERVEQTCRSPIDGESIDFRLNTECSYKCKREGLYMVNDETNDVVIAGGMTLRCDISRKWSDATPRCDPIQCPPLETPRNGYEPQCTDGREYQSMCTFKCHDKYDLSHSEPLQCRSSLDNGPIGLWSREPPQCIRSHCDDFGPVKHGYLNCTDGTRIGSVCSLSCKDRYTVKHYEETECLNTIEWSRRTYFCCVRCEFNSKIRIVAAYDASSFRSKLDWEYMVDFTESYLALLVRSGFDVEFSAFLYGRSIDRRGAFPMTNLYDRENISRAAEHLEYMCGLKCLREGVGKTEDALRHINSRIYRNVDVEREHFVVLRTSGRSRDRAIRVAEQMRKKNINILTVGIEDKRDVKAKLQKLAGRARNYLSVQKPSDLKDIPAKIIDISRDTGCTDASKSKSCLEN